MPDLYRQQHCTANGDPEWEFVEIDPTGRYGRYKEILGKGASKTVYRAFDGIEGMEVAWNQVNVRDVLQTPEDLERLYSEVHLLRTLNHENIIQFYTSWVDTKTKSINFITEMFTSGTLREYRQKHKQVDMRAIKNWARQILCGLHYLHSHDPPIIHRDLKCENVFVNGNRGEVKIGDLGLAAILRNSRLAHSVIGTPEFMAPELYDEEYNELVDIYAFGMCLLEMLTLEYPYSECSNPAQIYKKVTAGIKPDALYKVKDPEARQFVEKCLATACRRLPARDLLMDPFLRCDDHDSEYSLSRLSDLEHGLKGTENRGENACALQRNQQEAYPSSRDRILNKNEQSDWKHLKVAPFPSFHENNLTNNRDFTIKGKRREDDTIFLRVRIADKEGRVRNIYFPFDVESDTAMSVASEMVAELDITDHDVIEISDMIDQEISALVPDWKEAVAVDDCGGREEGLSSDHSTSKSIENDFRNMFDHLSTVSSGSSQLNCLTFHNFTNKRSGSVPSIQVEGAVHGLFEEVTCHVNQADISYFMAEEAPMTSSKSLDIHQDTDDWAHGEDPLSPSSSFSNGSGAVIFPASDESQSCCILLGTGNRQHDSSFEKSAKPKAEARLIDDTNEAREEAGWDCLLFDPCGFQRYGLPEGFSSSSYRELGCFSNAHGCQLNPLLQPFNCLSDEDKDSVCREVRLLAARHEQELIELEKKHELSVIELKNCLRNEKSISLSPTIPSIGHGLNGTCLSQNEKMTLNALQELDKDHWSRYCRESKLENQGAQVDMASMDQFTATSTRQRISGICSSRLSRSSIVSPDIFSFSNQATTPHRLTHKNSSTNQRLTKMHSFGGIYCQSYLSSLAAEMNRRLYQTFGEFGTKALNITQDFPRGMR